MSMVRLFLLLLLPVNPLSLIFQTDTGLYLLLLCGLKALNLCFCFNMKRFTEQPFKLTVTPPTKLVQAH